MACRIYCDICGCEIKDEEDKIEIKYRNCNQSAFNKYYSVTTHTKCAEHAVKELSIVGVIEKYKQ